MTSPWYLDYIGRAPLSFGIYIFVIYLFKTFKNTARASVKKHNQQRWSEVFFGAFQGRPSLLRTIAYTQDKDEIINAVSKHEQRKNVLRLYDKFCFKLVTETELIECIPAYVEKDISLANADKL